MIDIACYGIKGGPLPEYPGTSVVSRRFWMLYQNPCMPKIIWGDNTSGISYQAAQAGWDRHRAEPGINPETDSRCRLRIVAAT
jgi:hypothetical protein